MSEQKIHLSNSDIIVTMRSPTLDQLYEVDLRRRKQYQQQLCEYAEAFWDNSDVDHRVLEWSGEILSLSLMEQCFTKEDALQWLAQEIKTTYGDGRSIDDYLMMLAHGSKHPVVVYLDENNTLTVGDGWHRIAIAMIRQTTVYAVVGRDKKETAQ